MTLAGYAYQAAVEADEAAINRYERQLREQHERDRMAMESIEAELAEAFCEICDGRSFEECAANHPNI